jgi:hypothetical protein
MWYGEQFYCPDPLVDWMVGYGLYMDPCWVNMLLYGSLYPIISIKGSILEINHLGLYFIGLHTGDGVLMVG